MAWLSREVGRGHVLGCGDCAELFDAFVEVVGFLRIAEGGVGDAVADTGKAFVELITSNSMRFWPTSLLSAGPHRVPRRSDPGGQHPSRGTDNSRAVHDGSVATSVAFIRSISEVVA